MEPSDWPPCGRCGTTEPPAANGLCSNAKCRCFRPGHSLSRIVGHHGATFWREHEAEIRATAAHFARDAGYAALDDAPLVFQIAVTALARTQKIAELAYKRMVEGGGPLSESGKPRRAYSIWHDTNQSLARELRAVIEPLLNRPQPADYTSGITEIRRIVVPAPPDYWNDRAREAGITPPPDAKPPEQDDWTRDFVRAGWKVTTDEHGEVLLEPPDDEPPQPTGPRVTW